jgi:hypothetical protein
MRSRFRVLLLALALLGAPPGCRSDDLVELRLYPCEFGGIEPRAVTVEVTGFDAEGNVVETLEVSFDDIAATTFADGYATVGYRKHDDVVRARFRVGWFEAASAGDLESANAIAVYEQLDVPVAGEVLVLGELAADCAELIADGTSDDVSETQDDDADTSSDDADTSSDDVDTSSDDVDTSSDDVDTSSDDVDTMDTLDTSSDTMDTETTDTSGGPPGPEVGDACVDPFTFYCTGGPTPEDAGIPLLCNAQMMLEATDGFAGACIDGCIDGGAVPVNGCGDIGVFAKCMCQSIAAPNCGGEALGCVAPDELHLCFEGKVVKGTCVNCTDGPEGWYLCD